MAQFRKDTDAFSSDNKTQFETVMLATRPGAGPVSEYNPLPVDIIRFYPDEQLDSQGALRVSQVGQQWWYVPAVDKDGDLHWKEQFAGVGAQSNWIQNFAAVQLTPGTENTGSVIRASRRRHKLRPNVPYLWFGVVNMDGIDPNVTKRWGMFTNFNGMFFELTTDLAVVIRRRLPDGTLVEKRIMRPDFNGDKLNGLSNNVVGQDNPRTSFPWDTPPVVATILSVQSQATVAVSATSVYNVVYNVTSGHETKYALGTKVTITGITPATFMGAAVVKAIDTVNHRIEVTYTMNPGTFASASTPVMTQTFFHSARAFWFDFSGNRTNDVRFGIIQQKGERLTLHSEQFGGSLAGQFESAPSFVSRFEVFNTGPVSYKSTMTMHGSGFNAESELQHNPSFGIARNNTFVEYNKTLTEEFPIVGLGLRLGEPYQRADIQVQSVQIQDIGNVNPQNAGVFYWRLLFNPTLNGSVPATTNIGKASRQWAFNTASTFTGGIELMAGYASSGDMVPVQAALNFLNIGSHIDYTDADKIVLVAKLLTGGTANSKLVGLINFIEGV